jgi:hypothetical protein
VSYEYKRVSARLALFIFARQAKTQGETMGWHHHIIMVKEHHMMAPVPAAHLLRALR